MDIIDSSSREALALLRQIQSFINENNLRRIHGIARVPISSNLSPVQFSQLFNHVIQKLAHEFNRLVEQWRKSLYDDNLIEVVYVLMMYVYFGIEYRERILDPLNARQMQVLQQNYSTTIAERHRRETSSVQSDTDAIHAPRETGDLPSRLREPSLQQSDLSSTSSEQNVPAAMSPPSQHVASKRILLQSQDPQLCLLRYQLNVYEHIYMSTVDGTNGDLMADRKIISDPNELIMSSAFSIDTEIMQVLRGVLKASASKIPSQQQGRGTSSSQQSSTKAFLRCSTPVQGCRRILHTYFLDRLFSKYLVYMCVLSTETTQQEVEFGDVKYVEGGNSMETVLSDQSDVVKRHDLMMPECWIEDSVKVKLVKTPLSVYFDYKYKVVDHRWHEPDPVQAFQLICDEPSYPVMWWNADKRSKKKDSRTDALGILSSDSEDSFVMEETLAANTSRLPSESEQHESKVLKELFKIDRMEEIRRKLFLR